MIARRRSVIEAFVREELVEDLTARAITRCVPLRERSDAPVRARPLTSQHVLDVADELARQRADHGTRDAPPGRWQRAQDARRRHRDHHLTRDHHLAREYHPDPDEPRRLAERRRSEQHRHDGPDLTLGIGR